MLESFRAKARERIVNAPATLYGSLFVPVVGFGINRVVENGLTLHSGTEIVGGAIVGLPLLLDPEIVRLNLSEKQEKRLGRIQLASMFAVAITGIVNLNTVEGMYELAIPAITMASVMIKE